MNTRKLSRLSASSTPKARLMKMAMWFRHLPWACPKGYPATTEVTVLLEDLGGRTKMVMTHAGVPADSGAGGGWNQAFDKLADLISKK